MSNRSRRSIYIEDDQWVALVAESKRTDVSVAHLVRRAVADFLRSGIVPSNIHSTERAPEGELVPEALGPALRTTGEPILPAEKLVTRHQADQNRSR